MAENKTTPAEEEPPSIINTQVPLPEATPNEVRAYLVHILITKHDATPDFAQDVAARWKLGRGWDLLESPEQKYREILGDDVGPHLLKTIRMEWRNEQHAQKRLEMDRWWNHRTRKDIAVNAAVLSIFPAALIMYLYGRVATAIYVAIIPQVLLAFKLPDDKCAPVLAFFVSFSFLEFILYANGL